MLTIEVTEKSRSKYSKPSSIDALLDNPPSEISDAYETILAKSQDSDLTRILLQLVLAATRSLSLEEVNPALTLATQKACTSDKEVLLQ